MFLSTQDIALVKWRGRWCSDRTLEHYLQELGAAALLVGLPRTVRATVATMAQHAKPLILKEIAEAEILVKNVLPMQYHTADVDALLSRDSS